MARVFVAERKSDREKADKLVRYIPKKYIVIEENDIVVELQEGRMYVFPYTRKNSSDFKEIKEVKVSARFVLDAIKEAERNEIFQAHIDEFLRVTN